MYEVEYVNVPRELEYDRGNKTDIDFRIEIPQKGSAFPQARSKNGMSKKEIARATRAFFAREYPPKVAERVQAFMDGKGWSLIWTPLCMPRSEPLSHPLP